VKDAMTEQEMRKTQLKDIEGKRKEKRGRQKFEEMYKDKGFHI